MLLAWSNRRHLCSALALLTCFGSACSSNETAETAAKGGANQGGEAAAGGQAVGGAGGRTPDSSAGAAGNAGQGTGATSGSLGPGWHNVVVGGGGFIDGIVFHPGEAGLVYLRTDMGGAYRFDVPSSSWRPITDSIGRAQVDSYGVLSLAIDPNDTQRVYLMTGKYTQSWAGPGAVLASKDRGATWSRAELTVKVGGNEDGRGAGERLQVDPNLGSRLFMGTTRDGLWQSLDSGVTWTKVMSFMPSNVNFVAFDKASAGKGQPSKRIFVGTASTTDSLWQSVDGGNVWSAVPGQPAAMMALRWAFAGANLYLTYANMSGPNGATSGSLQRLDLATLSFAQASPPVGSYGFGGVTVDAKDPNRVLVSTLDRWAPHDEVYQSPDNGKTFVPLLALAKWDRSFAPYTSASSPHWLSDLQLDPFDSGHALFVTGYGVWACTGLTEANTNCAFQNQGIEQTVAAQLITPPSGAPLLSAMGDIDGFKHDQLDVSPKSRFTPQVGTTLGIAFAESAPLKIVKAYDASPFGATSSDGGETWQKFATFPAGTMSGGWQSIALSADGARIVWAPKGAVPSWSSDQGSTWHESTGLTAGIASVADRVNPNKFYALDALTGRVLLSGDGGASYTVGAMGLGTLPDYLLRDGSLAAVFGQEGHLWLTLGNHGLLRSTDGGLTFAPVTGVNEAFAVGFGKAKAGASYPALYLWATIGTSTGVFRSDDEGKTFSEVTDPAHKFGTIHSVTGDRNVYGRVFLGTEGRGIQYFNP